jgi:hypothetical protein
MARWHDGTMARWLDGTMMDIGEIFRRYGDEYLKRFGQRMLPSHIKAVYDISKCRTEAAGGHVDKCPKCGHKEYYYHSCGNRNCPQCHRADNNEWLQNIEGNQPEPANGSGDSGDHNYNRKLCPKCKKCEMVFLKRLFPQKHPLGGRSPPCSPSYV